MRSQARWLAISEPILASVWMGAGGRGAHCERSPPFYTSLADLEITGKPSGSAGLRSRMRILSAASTQQVAWRLARSLINSILTDEMREGELNPHEVAFEGNLSPSRVFWQSFGV
jgi:hypothetical protein